MLSYPKKMSIKVKQQAVVCLSEGCDKNIYRRNREPLSPQIKSHVVGPLPSVRLHIQNIQTLQLQTQTVTFLFNVASSLLWIVSILVISFYLVKDADRLRAALDHLAPPGYAEELRRLREEIIGRRESKDAMALHEQWHRQNALLKQLRVSRDAPQVDPRCPYFARMRLQEEGAEQDLCLGRATCIGGGLHEKVGGHFQVHVLFELAQEDQHAVDRRARAESEQIIHELV